MLIASSAYPSELNVSRMKESVTMFSAGLSKVSNAIWIVPGLPRWKVTAFVTKTFLLLLSPLHFTSLLSVPWIP